MSTQPGRERSFSRTGERERDPTREGLILISQPGLVFVDLIRCETLNRLFMLKITQKRESVW
jgi:hypothetical protein